MTWSQEWKLNLNAEKSEVCPFSTWSNDSTWNPTIFIGNQKVRVNTTPHLLGVILDRSLTFNAHLKKLTASFTSTIHIIRATALRLEALRLDANVQSYPTCSKSLILKAKEKALHSTDDHPKHIALDVDFPQCLQNHSSFCRKAEELPPLSCHLIFNTDKTSFIFHLHYGSKAPLTKDELPPLLLELPVELMTIT